MDKDKNKAISLMGKEPENPIGSCFDSSAHQVAFGEDPPEDLRLCHGIGVANMPGQEGDTIIHAWVEVDIKGRRAALDTTWGVCQEAKVYRKNLCLSYVVEYTRDELFKNWKEYNMPGPWDEKIRALASD